MRAPFALPLAAALAVSACSRPEPPTITPISGRATAINSKGVTVDVRLEAYNPNSVELGIGPVSAKLVVDGHQDLGTVTVSPGLTLPARDKTAFDVPITFAWHEVFALAPLAMQGRDIPFVASGTAKVTASSLTVEAPFTVNGVVTRQQLLAGMADPGPAASAHAR